MKEVSSLSSRTGLGMKMTDKKTDIKTAKKTASQNSVRWHGQNDGQINLQMKTAKTTAFIELSHCNFTIFFNFVESPEIVM